MHQSKPNGCRKYRCKSCGHIFSDTSGTVFHRSRISLQLWFFAINEFFQNRDITSVELAHRLGIRQQKAWKMLALLKKNSREIERLFLNDVTSLVFDESSLNIEREVVSQQKYFAETSVVSITKENVFTPTPDEINFDRVEEISRSEKQDEMKDVPAPLVSKKKMRKFLKGFFK